MYNIPVYHTERTCCHAGHPERYQSMGNGTLFKFGFHCNPLVIMLIFLLCAYLCKRAINRWIRKKEIVNAKFVMRIVKITLYTIAIYGCLSLLTPFESVLGKIWGSAGIIAVVLGLAAQESMGNFVNGLLITTFKPFKIPVIW